VLALQRGQVEIREDVAVQHHEPLTEQALVGGEPDRARRAQRLVLLNVGDRGAARDLVAQRAAQVLRPEATGHHDLVDPVTTEPLDHVADEGTIDQRQRRLGLGQGQRTQPRALPPDQDESLHQAAPFDPERPMPS
jgi:hypothetical protein